MTDLPATGASHEFTLRFSQADFDEFARISGDHNPIHVDPQFAARTRFGRTVAHGMFLFGTAAAATARWFAGPVHVLEQQLMFTAPTFADEDVTLILDVVDDGGGGVTLTQRMYRGDGQRVAAGSAVVSRSPETNTTGDRPAHGSSPDFKGIEVGMAASSRRSFTAEEVTDFCRLVDDPNPLFARGCGNVPPALIGGVVSQLLGVELPGPGANWLKQHYRFLRPVEVGEELLTTVEVSRIRPDKALVDLTNTATSGDATVMTGETLVLAADVSDRTG